MFSLIFSPFFHPFFFIVIVINHSYVVHIYTQKKDRKKNNKASNSINDLSYNKHKVICL